MEFLNDVWENVKKNLREIYSDSFIELWFSDMKLEVLNNTDAVFVNGSDLKAKILTDKHLSNIKQAMEDILGYEITVTILSAQNGQPNLMPYIDGTAANNRKQTSSEPTEEVSKLSPSAEKIDIGEFEQARNVFPPNHSNYTFDDFIVGNSNKFAYEACIAVCNSLATQFNPLFIYGPSGLGKTHLLYSINNYVLQKNPKANIVYVKGEEFSNQLIENISNKSPVAFREKFRDVFRKTDILLMDDIQFIAGKEASQEETFHTFNALYDAGKQIILTSDRPPKDISKLEERLRTRFEGGLIVDIQPPDFELRVAVIKAKAKNLGVTLDNDVMYFLAENLRNNIRQLEGAVKTLAAHSFLKGTKIDIELASSCINEITLKNVPVNVTIDRIFEKVSRKYNLSVEEIKGERRNHDIIRARHISIYIIKKLTGLSLGKIGDIFSRDHSTIKSSLNKTEKEIREDSLLEIEINDIIEEISM